MLLRLMAVTAVAVAAMYGTASAADNNTNAGTSATQQNTGTSEAQQNTGALPREISQKLKDEGFTDVKVVPGSFLVSAKDKSGDPVSMIIGPHSMTMFTMVSPESSTTGNSSSTGSSSQDQNNTSK